MLPTKRKCSSPPTAGEDGLSPLHTTTDEGDLREQIALHNTLVKKCTAVATAQGFFALYETWRRDLNDGAHSFDGPMSVLINMHLKGEAASEIAAIYDVLVAESDALHLPPKEEFVKPAGTNLLALEVLALISFGATAYFEDGYKCFS